MIYIYVKIKKEFFMANDRVLIKELEERLGIKLEELPPDELMVFGKRGYTVDAMGSVVGLSLSLCKLSNLPSLTLEKLTQLKILVLTNNQINDISALEKLTLLIELYLNNNQISDISALEKLTLLKTLVLTNNQISDISALKKLTLLKTLVLNNNQISDISALEKLILLSELYLNNNQINDISALRKSTLLTELYLNNNQIRDISTLEKLTLLTVLYLNINQINDISALEKLILLSELYLNNNQINDISALEKLVLLKALGLNNNQINDISVLKKLTQITNLYLNNNQISDISALEKLKRLRLLALKNNRFTLLPIGLARLGMEIKWEHDPFVNAIFLEGNPLESPPVEIIRQGTEAVMNYIEELEKEQEQLMQCKILIVGNGEVGKTSLMKKLMDNDYQVMVGKEETTHGIHIKPWSIKCPFQDCKDDETVNVHFWDFGGQAIYHATHQFFLTKRSLYLFVWEARKEEEAQTFDYWLNIIKLLGKQSPVLVVMNKSDVRIKHLDEALFKKKFDDIVTFFKVSTKTGDGIPELTERIRSTLSAMPHLRDKLPKSWLDIRTRLEAAGDEINYITIGEYYRICRETGGGMKEERADFLSDYLHDLGVILHFREDPLLERTVILNPEWATEAVYTLIDTREIQQDKGRFQYDDLKRHWDPTKYPRDKHLELMQLMEKFELCFNIVGTDRYIVPELLPPEQPTSTPFDTGRNQPTASPVLRFDIRYDFMPSGIISRFISRCHYMIRDELFWKNGAVLRLEQATARVTSDPLARKTSIAATGTDAGELMALIRNELNIIHCSLNMKKNIHYKEEIPCNCEDCIQSDEPHFYKYASLKLFTTRGFSEVPCENSGLPVPIAPMLKGYESPEVPEPERLLQSILSAVHHLLDIAKSLKSDENSRNDFISKLMTAKGIMVKDQSRGGRSASGKSIGNPDFKITDANGEIIAVMEAFNLTCCNTTSINLHCKKLFSYDAVGVERNFVLVYAGTGDFIELWKKYLDHIRSIEFEYNLEELQEINVSLPKNRSTASIKIARARHTRNGTLTEVYHIFADVKK
jgi:internalin A